MMPTESQAFSEPYEKRTVSNHADSREEPGSHIGPYKLLERIGEGGTGVIFMAEQQEPVHRVVAIKVINNGQETRQAAACLDAERKALARLDHPNVVKVFDAGTTLAGHPYFVMELIKGVPITTYCDEHRLSLRQRLELLLPACQAVQHAHQKGVIHGALRPSNVLVASYNNRPTAKVIDFGVAEAVRCRLTEHATSADASALAGVLEYLSPEEADLNTVDIDTRSDVYSLGAILYELLTGATPLPLQRLKEATVAEALQWIREEDVLRPSAQLSESKDALSVVAAQRRQEPTALVKGVHEELDCLVMKALQKDRTRRYETVNDLAREIERYLADEPVEACSPSIAHRLWKWLRKRPRRLASAAAILLLLLASVVAAVGIAVWAIRVAYEARTTAQQAEEERDSALKAAAKAKQQRDKALAARNAAEEDRTQELLAEKAAQRSEEDVKAVLAFLQNNLLSAGRPAAGWEPTVEAKNVTLHQAVNAAEARVTEAFSDRPLAEASVRELLGSTYLDLGEPSQSVKQYERALSLREAQQGEDDPETGACRNQLAVAYRLAGRPVDADRLYAEAPNSPARAAELARSGSMLLAEKKPTEAELKLRECLAIRQRVQPDGWTTFDAKSLLGEALLDQKKYADAEPLLLAGYEGMKQRESQMSPKSKVHIVRAIERLVRLYEILNKKDKAAKWRKELEGLK